MVAVVGHATVSFIESDAQVVAEHAPVHDVVDVDGLWLQPLRAVRALSDGALGLVQLDVSAADGVVPGGGGRRFAQEPTRWFTVDTRFL